MSLARHGDLKSARSIDPRQRAVDFYDSGRRASQRLAAKLRAVGELYGDPARLVLQRAAEDVEENMAEAALAWRDETEKGDERQREIHRQASDLRSVVVDAAAEIQRRYGKRLPDELRPLVDAAGAIWPHLYPPDDERHQHETNASGACKHATCRYLSRRQSPRGAVLVMSDAWEAFTSVGSDRPLKQVTVRQLHDPELYDWPDEEIHHGIAGWQIHCHGDDPGGAFVECWGRTSEAVEDCLGRLVQFVTSGGTTALYPEEHIT